MIALQFNTPILLKERNMFSQCRNLAISGGTFTQVANQGIGARGVKNPFKQTQFTENRDLLHTASSPSAIHDSRELFPPPKCHANTRVAVIEQLIMEFLQ